jgi:FMN phosphatase YigB (HAD superfamily)
VLKTILFDLSETVIAGLVGIEAPLAQVLGVDQAQILPAFGGDLLARLCRGQLTEDQYLALILEQQRWEITAEALKRVFRLNFHKPVPGMWKLLQKLSGHYELVLLSDHAREWVVYIQSVYPELAIFNRQYYSFQYGRLKSEPETFLHVLKLLKRKAGECLFVDDNPTNIAAAEEAGLSGTRFVGAQDLERELVGRGLIRKEF